MEASICEFVIACGVRAASLAGCELRRAASQAWSTRSCLWRCLPWCSRLAPSGRPLMTAGSCDWASAPPRTRFRARVRSEASATSFCSETRGQSSVEAALFVPVFMLLLALLLQPVFLLYTRASMQQAAAEGVRLLSTREGSGAATDDACVEYVKRRLAAVPDVPAFHTGEWEVEVMGDASGKASVKVVGHLRPLPLIGVLASALGEADGDCVVLTVEASGGARPSWLEGGYCDWVKVWE